ncbi:MAG: ATP-binding protein [Fibrobacterota bacterium]
MKREIITIDEKKCTGCGLCVPGCPESAIQIIDGKARLVSDLLCDGLGACIGECPEEAISIEKREAKPYDEKKVIAVIAKQGMNTVRAHLKHLKEHGQEKYFAEAVEFLKDAGINTDGLIKPSSEGKEHKGCPGSSAMEIDRGVGKEPNHSGAAAPSELTHWPVQMHLISTSAQHYRKSDFVLAADCTAFASGNFHAGYLKGKSLGIACPKLDSAQEIYAEKIKSLIDDAGINTLTVITMEVPCCRGLLNTAVEAVSRAGRKVPLKSLVIGINGEIVSEQWL